MGEERERGWIFVENLKALMDRERASEKKNRDRLQEMEKGNFFIKKIAAGVFRGVYGK